MMIRLRHVLIWAALMFGQGLLAAHAYDHPVLDLQDHACQICAHGHPDGGAPPSSGIEWQQSLLSDAGLRGSLPQQHAAPLSVWPAIRAPPVLSC